MRLAIIHHHLNRGGVSQVISNHLRSLSALPETDHPEQVVLIFDGQADGWPKDDIQDATAFPIDTLVIDRIGYDQPDSTCKPELLADQIESSLSDSQYSPTDTVLHWHNHSLGKNASVPDTITILAKRGWKIMLQVHDFAEDNRPANYLHLQNQLGATEVLNKLYPQANNIHYATLTSRDASILSAANVDASKLTTLPNPVLEFDSLPSRNEVRQKVFDSLSIDNPGTRLLVYPVRGIRRKNVGEMLLLSALSKDLATPSCFAITLAPKNLNELQSFQRWKQLAIELNLPCRFDTGGSYQVDFLNLLASSDAILTTSIAEGFGMAFMEAWLIGKPLVGRDLPDITVDFKQAGLNLDSLYPELGIPTDLVDIKSVFGSLVESYQALREAYQLKAEPTESIRYEYDQVAADGMIDFARLPSNHQQTVIELASHNSSVREYIAKNNKSLMEVWLASEERDQKTIEQNRESVLTNYCESSIGNRLHQTYSSLLSRTSVDEVDYADGNRVLNWFITPKKIIPIRIES